MCIDSQPQDSGQEPHRHPPPDVPEPEYILTIFGVLPGRSEGNMSQGTCSTQSLLGNDLNSYASNYGSPEPPQQWLNIIQHQQLLLSRRSQRKTFFTHSSGVRRRGSSSSARSRAHFFVLSAPLLSTMPDCAIIVHLCCFTDCSNRPCAPAPSFAVQHDLRLTVETQLAVIISPARSNQASISSLQLGIVLLIPENVVA